MIYRKQNKINNCGQTCVSIITGAHPQYVEQGLTKEDPRVAKYVRYGKDTHAYGKVGYRKGAKHTEEAKKKISEVQIGRKTSKETREKMSKSHKKVPVICLTNGKEYESMMAAAKDLGLNSGNIYGALKGRAKTVRGYIFKYKEVNNA